jgi:hypothetical protein
MTLIFKLLAMLLSLATTSLLLFESARRGLLILTTVLGLLKIIIFVSFLALLVIVGYLIFRPAKAKQTVQP